MKSIKRYHKILFTCLFSTLLLTLLLLSGCSDDDDDDNAATSYKFTVKVTNITYGQPLTPAAVVLHTSGFAAGWSIGTKASVGLEKLAESGDTTDFITDAMADNKVLTTGVAGTAAFLPGTSVSVDLTIAENKGALLSYASMLAKTNDAFVGSQKVSIGELELNETMTIFSNVHDSGTESNTESAGTMPAVNSGEGFNAARDDIHDFVTFHTGIVSADDGLTNSVLDETNRWLGQAAMVEITRTQ